VKTVNNLVIKKPTGTNEKISAFFRSCKAVVLSVSATENQQKHTTDGTMYHG